MRRELIKLKLSRPMADDEGIVPCYRIGVLALHNRCADGAETVNWLISHIPTGRFIRALPPEMRFKDAKELTMLLDQAFDWANVTRENSGEIATEVRQFIYERLR